MTDVTRRLALPVLLAGGLALSACSFAGGTDAGEASATSTAASTGATTTTAATTTAAPATTTAAPAATAAPEPSGADPTTAGGPDRCHTSELTGSLGQPDAGVGNRYLTLTLTDTGGEVCTVYGFGGIGLVAPDGTAMPTRQVRAESPAPRTVTLQPGQAVTSTLHWTAVATGSEPVTGDCEPLPGRLTVIPPNETDALSVSWPGGPVCDFGQIEQTAYVAA